MISKQFNEYFVNIGVNLANKIPTSNVDIRQNLPDRISSSFFLTPTTEDEVSKIINKLKDTSAGWDDIAPKIIKHIKEEILMPITYLCNLSFITGEVPSGLKRGRVSPIHKSGEVN